MRSSILLFLASALASVISCSAPCEVLSSELSFIPSGDSNTGAVKGEVPLPLLGGLPLKNGSAVINDKVVALKCAPDELSDAPRTVLAGSILRTESTVNGNSSSITGLVVFLMGEWMSQIDDQTQLDVIFRKEGQVRGRIIGREADNIILQTAEGSQRKVPLSTVLYIRSPRVFVFTVQARNKGKVENDSPYVAEAVTSTFRPTATPRSVSLSSVVPHKEGEEPAEKNSALSPSQMFDEDELPTTPMPRFTGGPPTWMPATTGFQ